MVQQVNRLHFSDETDIVVLSEIYEDLLKRVAGDSAGYAGEFYTQRHIIRAMVEVVQPQIGERLYDPCFGTAGFLAESAEKSPALPGTQWQRPRHIEPTYVLWCRVEAADLLARHHEHAAPWDRESESRTGEHARAPYCQCL